MTDKMVGYYSECSTAMSLSNLENKPASLASTLVCSPDLSVFNRTADPTSTVPSTIDNSNERLVPSIPVPTPTTSAPDALVKPQPFKCLLCQKNFDHKSAYQSHLRSHGKEGEDPYRCNICSKTFAVPARLTRHYRTHTGEKPYQCEYCNKSFSVKENLSVHRRIHTKERPYKCDVCERAFEHSGKLHRHMRIHTGERPHKCLVCAKTFIQSGQLVIHMRTHTGEKPYVCKSCGKGFTCSKQLKVHTRTHTGEKPYTCEICGKSFGYNHVLKLHQVAHYGEKVYKCTLCHETFNSKKTMELHIKTHSDSSASPSQVSRDSPIEPVIEISQGSNPVSNDMSVSDASSVSSDKENKTDLLFGNHQSTTRDLSYYLYQRDHYNPDGNLPTASTGVNPALLAAAAAAAVDDKLFSPVSSSNQESLFLYPQNSAYNSVNECPLLNLPGNDARRRVEAALEAVEEERQREYAAVIDRQPILTPPNSNPVSPVASPNPLDLAIPTAKETLSLPPRKRCKMILESMESQRLELTAQRHNSVIQFARAS